MIVPCRALWPKSSSVTDTVTHWGYLAGKLHGSPLLRPLLICLRGVRPFAETTHQPVHKPAYDDTFILESPTSMPMVFEGASHAYQLDSKLSPDVNGDGRGDVGSIKPGTYLLTDLRAGEWPVFKVTMPGGSGLIPCWRDDDHDGVIAEMNLPFIERGKSVGLFATDILLHPGFSNPESPHRSSIGCSTADAKYLRILSDIARGFEGKIDYVLINAWDAVTICEGLADRTEPEANA